MRTHVAVLAVGLVAVLVAGCRADRPEPAASLGPPVPVAVLPIQPTKVPVPREVAGTVRPAERAAVASRIAGFIVEADTALGRRVAAGEVLVRLEAAELIARVAQAEAALAQSERDVERERTLVARGVSTADTLASVEDQRRIARAALDEARALAAYTVVAAPFAGRIVADPVNPGDLAQPGTVLFEIEGEDRLQLETQVPESLPLPSIGAPLVVRLDRAEIRARLAEVSPSADPASRTRLARIDLPPEAQARSGQFGRALWPAGEEEVLLVPATSIQTEGQMDLVWLVIDGRASLRIVRTGARMGDRVEVVSGLRAGDTLVLRPSPGLREGQPVQPETEQP